MQNMSDVHVFDDEELLPVKIKEMKGTHQGNAANTATDGSSKNRKRTEGYIEDKKSRTDCRYKRVHGIIRAIRDLKACTGDDVFRASLHNG